MSIELSGDEARFETRDSRLVAALMAVGVRPIGREPVRIVTRSDRPGEDFQFYLETMTECGRYRTRDLVAAWREGLAWIVKNEDHPFAYAMAAQMNHQRLIGYIKNADRLVCIRRGDAVALLSANASLELEEQVLGMFS